MERIIHDLVQGTPLWHQHRQSHLNASEAPAMVGISKYQSRADLLKQRATGVTADVDVATEVLFANGHKFEAQAREWAAEIIGAPLFPITASAVVDGLPLSASYDGATAEGDTVWEHKTLSAELAKSLDAGVIPDQYKPQMVQQMLILEASKCLFMASNGDRKTMRSAWYEYDPAKGAKLIAAWKQFQADLAEYQHIEVLPPVTAAPVMSLPTLFIQARGEITKTNMPDFKAQVTEFISTLNMTPATDQEFADGKDIAKRLRELAVKMKERKADMLAQTATIGKVATEIDYLAEVVNASALKLEKAVEREENSRKLKIVMEGKTALAEHVVKLNTLLGAPYMPVITADFADAIKGKRLIAAMENAVATLLANKKIEANEVADRIGTNLLVMADHAEYAFLFSDLTQLILKAPDDFVLAVQARIQAHVVAEAKWLEGERDRIRLEEQQKAEAAARDKVEAERAALIEASEAKARQDSADRAVEDKRIAVELAEMEKRLQAEQSRAAAPVVEHHTEQDIDQILVGLYERVAGVKKYSAIAKAIKTYLDKAAKTKPDYPITDSIREARAL